MLQWAVTFLVIALISGVLGFSDLAALSVEFARILFVVFIVLFAIAALMHALRGKPPSA